MRRARLSTAAVLLGIGLGGLLNAILFERILQWHRHAGGGWFDLGLWLAALVGVVFLWSALRAPGRMPSDRALAGHALLGWGGFNFVDSLVFHHMLDLHHLRDLPWHVPEYDWIWVVVAGVGALVVSLALRDAPDPHPVVDRRSGVDRRLGVSL